MERAQLALATPYSPPRTDLERRLAGIWAEILTVDTVGLDDDFFDLGGDSMSATLLCTRVSDDLGLACKPGQLLEASTPRAMLAMLANSDGELALPSNIIAVNPGGKRRPLFMIHGAAGISFIKPEFLSGLDPEQPIYNFQARGYDGAADPFDTVEEIAASYLRSILEIDPDGPWNLVAFCAGGLIAAEIVHQMAQENRKPDKVILVDLGIWGPHADQWRNRQRPVANLDIPVISPLAAQLYVISDQFIRRMHMLLRTGHFVSKYEMSSFRHKRVREYLLSRMKRKHRMRGDRVLADVMADEPAEQTKMRRKLAGIYALDAAALTSVKLELAFRAYDPRPLDVPVYLLVSDARGASLHDPQHPLNVFFPHKQVLIIGETHSEVVTSRKCAKLIQGILDEAEPAPASFLASVPGG